ncbi:MAG TPA: LPP20 family lipoprotein [Gammaproteobacteria bacterium]|nr:LPP20 family lipoprotein [Gammaproteobacteria bacterium]
MAPTKLIPLAVPILLLVACSHAPRPDAKPAWVDGPATQYPASRFLIGRGEAAQTAVARDRARADLAKTFSVKVSEHGEDVSSYSQDGQQPAANALDVSRRITTQTNALLKGVRIADTWQDPATHTYYALAVLSRPQTAAALREQIADLDANTRARLLQARDSNDLLTKIAAADRAVTAQTTRAGLQSELRVVDITGHGSTPPWNLGQLQANRAALLKRLTINAAADGQNAAAVQKLLAGALADAGFTVQSGAPYTMTATLDYKNLPPRNGWYWIAGTLSVALNGSNQARGIKRWPLKVSATDPGLAQQRLMEQVAQNLHNDIEAATLQFAGARGTTD